MATTLPRRGFLRLLGLVPALALPAGIARARDESPRIGQTDAPEPSWASEWPPTAVPGKLVRCEEEPGYYTTRGMPALFYGRALTFFPLDPYQDDDPLIRAIRTGVSGFPVEREIDPPDGMHVIEVGLRETGRYAVVRHG